MTVMFYSSLSESVSAHELWPHPFVSTPGTAGGLLACHCDQWKEEDAPSLVWKQGVMPKPSAPRSQRPQTEKSGFNFF